MHASRKVLKSTCSGFRPEFVASEQLMNPATVQSVPQTEDLTSLRNLKCRKSLVNTNPYFLKSPRVYFQIGG